MQFAAEWLTVERDAWARPKLVTPSEWAEENRTLSRDQSERHGRLSHANAPYLVGFMDIGSDRERERYPAARHVEEVYGVKPAQIGVSEAVRSIIGHAAEREPDPMLLVLPSETKGREIVKDRIIPLFLDTPCLARLTSDRKHDKKMSKIRLINGLVLRLGFSGSPTSLASDPARFVFLDEVDKYAGWTGKEGSPIALARARSKTYWRNRRIYCISTPTTRNGYIWSLAEAASIKLRYLVPCPHCRKVQPLSLDRLKWAARDDLERNAHADWLEETPDSVWFACRHCGLRIDESHKPRMAAAGVWATEAHDGCDVADIELSPSRICYAGWPIGRRVAMFFDPFYCLWVRWREIAAGFLRAKGSPADLMEFVNQTLGQIFEQQIERPKAGLFQEKAAAGGPEGKLPTWTKMVLMTVDVQKDHFWYVIRAWGVGYRSRRIEHGRVLSLGEIERLATAVWPGETAAIAGQRCRMVGIDVGYKPYDIYALTLRSKLFKALKGDGKPLWVPPRARRISYAPPDHSRSAMNVFVHLWYPNHYKSLLMSRINGTISVAEGEAPQWELSNKNDPEYAAQMSAEHCVPVRKGSQMIETWVKIGGAANHLWDCEAMQMALAEIARLDLQTDTVRRSYRDRVTDRRQT